MYHIMLTFQRGLKTAVQVMNFHREQIITFTLDEMENEDFPKDLKEYILPRLDDIKEGKWHYTGEHKK
ncbi:hypothetical protein [Metabacillus sp. 84]|uniref:hypothetical protein n=1 Tax=Metabacillus sp. 84 TaxID=3404705 RepID=UPI003CE73C59